MIFDSCLFYFYLTQHHSTYKMVLFLSDSILPFLTVSAVLCHLPNASHPCTSEFLDQLWFLLRMSSIRNPHGLQVWQIKVCIQSFNSLFNEMTHCNTITYLLFPLYNFYLSVLYSIYYFLKSFIFKCLSHYCLNFTLYKLYKGRNFCYSLLYPNTRKAPGM